MIWISIIKRTHWLKGLFFQEALKFVYKQLKFLKSHVFISYLPIIVFDWQVLVCIVEEISDGVLFFWVDLLEKQEALDIIGLLYQSIYLHDIVIVFRNEEVNNRELLHIFQFQVNRLCSFCFRIHRHIIMLPNCKVIKL